MPFAHQLVRFQRSNNGENDNPGFFSGRLTLHFFPSPFLTWCSRILALPAAGGVECTAPTGVCFPKTHPVSNLRESLVDRGWKTPGWCRPWLCTIRIQVLSFFYYFFFFLSLLLWVGMFSRVSDRQLMVCHLSFSKGFPMWKVLWYLYGEWIFSPGVIWLSILVVFHWTGRGGRFSHHPEKLSLFLYIYISYQKKPKQEYREGWR